MAGAKRRADGAGIVAKRSRKGKTIRVRPWSSSPIGGSGQRALP
jgi:hypothetical protein